MKFVPYTDKYEGDIVHFRLIPNDEGGVDLACVDPETGCLDGGRYVLSLNPHEGVRLYADPDVNGLLTHKDYNSGCHYVAVSRECDL